MKVSSLASRLTLSLIAMTFAGAQASADGFEEGQWYVTPMASFMDDATKRGVDDDFNSLQLGFGRAINENWLVEFNLFGGNADDRYLGNDQKLRGVGVDWLRQFSNSSMFSPYALVGIGYLNTDISGPAEDREDIFGSIGLGLMTSMGDNGLALRTEARMRAVSGTPHLNDMYYSAGLQIPIGKKEPPAPVDTDGDGVPDINDRCPNTPAGARVGPDGCELDSDGDGVADSKDRCPRTPAGARVDANGCPIDSDGDGVADGIDQCPNTPMGVAVDAKGCALDSDGDGVVNTKDRCPNTRAGARVDVYGCEIKDQIDLPGVKFEFDSARLIPETTRVLDDAAMSLNNHPDITVEVAGHTDTSGDASYNKSLSTKRAKAVADYLVSKGVSADRMKTVGYGESEPMMDNSTKEGRAANRRVVLKILTRDY